MKRASARAALILLAVFTFASIAAPIFVSISGDPDAVDLALRFQSPSSAHLLGTDELGRDVFARMLWGGRVSLAVGFSAAMLSLLIGSAVGAIAGYRRGWIDATVMRLIEIVVSFPLLFLVLAIVAIAGPSASTVVLALGLTGWPTEARLVRGEMLRLREVDYALAARASGASSWRIIFRHLLPHAIAPAIASASFGVAIAILSESALSFLGLGVPLPRASWGNILAGATNHLGDAWWLALFPGLAIFLAAASFSLLGDELRRRLDPRLESGRRHFEPASK